MRNQNAAVQARTKAQNRSNVLQLKLVSSSPIFSSNFSFLNTYFGFATVARVCYACLIPVIFLCIGDSDWTESSDWSHSEPAETLRAQASLGVQTAAGETEMSTVDRFCERLRWLVLFYAVFRLIDMFSLLFSRDGTICEQIRRAWGSGIRSTYSRNRNSCTVSFIFVSDKWFLCLCFIYLMQACDYC